MTGRVLTLANEALGAALTAAARDPATDLGGTNSITFEAELLGGTGGTSVAVVAQTSFDGGSTWLDVARFDFTTTSARKWAVVQKNAAKAVASYAALASEGTNDGLIGDQLRAVLTSVGTYTNTVVALRAHVG